MNGVKSTYSYASFDYYNGGLTRSKQLANGVKVNYDYDKKLRLTQLTASRPDVNALSSFIYGYDKRDNITRVELGHANATFTYGYDFRNRLVSETCQGTASPTTPGVLNRFDNQFTAQAPGNSDPANPANQIVTAPWSIGGMPLPTPPVYSFLATYEYDDNGNRVTKSDNRSGQGTFTYQYDEENRLKRESLGAPSQPDQYVDFLYDNNGNMTRQVTKARQQDNYVKTKEDAYAYNHVNQLNMFTRLDGANQLTANCSHEYLPTGQRYKKNSLMAPVNPSQLFVCDGHDVVTDYAGQFAGPFTHAKSYVNSTSIDSKICEVDASGGLLSYYNTDKLGSVDQLINQVNAPNMPSVIDNQLTTAWGEPILTGSGDTRYGFTQRERDEESDLMYFRARHYSQRLGRFLQRDPINSVSEHYIYACNKPTFAVDPHGLEIVTDTPLDDFFKDKLTKYDKPKQDNEGQWHYTGKSNPVLSGEEARDGEILSAMIRSPRVFQIAGKEHALEIINIAKHVNARKGVVNFAKKLSFEYTPSEKMKANLVLWDVEGGFRPTGDAYAAFMDVRDNPSKYAMACEPGAIVALCGGIAEAMSASEAIVDKGKSFNALVGVRDIYRMRTQLTSSNNISPSDDWIPGDWGILMNPNPNATRATTGQNIVYLGIIDGSQKWYGTAGGDPIKTFRQWLKYVVDFSNKNRPPGVEEYKDKDININVGRRYPAVGLE